MKSTAKIWLLILPLLMAGCRNGINEPNAPREGTVVARVAAYNEAKLTGDTWRRMTVSFDNSSHSSGRISEDNTAIMTVRGIPDGWITGITVWMRSNKSSGAGSLSVLIGDSAVISLSGTFADWVGRYSDTNMPISTRRQAWKYDGRDIVLTIVGEINSLYLDRMEISYSDREPVFPPEEPDTDVTRLIQDTSFTDGEYALACNLDAQYLIAKGGWVNSKYIIMDSVTVTKNMEGLVVWGPKNWPEEMRYTLTFDGDSVIIYLPSEREYIGHNKASASKQKTKWAWKKAFDGSIYIHHDLNWHDGGSEPLNYWQAYSFYPWLEDTQTVARYMNIMWDENLTYWTLLKLEE